jgi:hypothetical protein
MERHVSRTIQAGFRSAGSKRHDKSSSARLYAGSPACRVGAAAADHVRYVGRAQELADRRPQGFAERLVALLDHGLAEAPPGCAIMREIASSSDVKWLT